MTLKLGDQVRHPSRGNGTVSTLIYNPLTGRPLKAWVEFVFIGTATRKYLCFADDLTVVPAVATPGKPALKVVEQPVVA